MKTILKVLFGLSVFIFSVSSSYAADVTAGEKKAAMCAGCHGEKGVNKNPMFPNLAGQKRAYISSQLRAFKKGTRVNSMMQHVAEQLSTEDMDNLAAFFSGLENKTKHPSKAEVKDKTENQANMCKGCHGSNGEGRGIFPKLSNQHIKYLKAQLKAFKSGDRENGMMQGMVRSLSDEDMEQLSIYFSGLSAEEE